MKKARKKICFICSAGGHFEEIRQLEGLIERYDHYFILGRNKATKAYPKKKYLVNDLCRKNLLFKLLSYAMTAFIQLLIFIKERPDFIITTGAAIAIPTCKIGLFFKKKVIYIESFARMNELSRSGKKMLNKADLFIVQWEQLAEKYPNVIYGGKLF